MIRKFFQSGKLKLSYLDNESNGKPILLCLHGHFACARYYAKLMEELSDDWHVYSLDQRGHGWSDHAHHEEYDRKNYIEDISIFIRTVLKNTPVFLLGHSLGGVNAYQFAAKYNNLVKGILIEDMGVIVNGDPSEFCKMLPEKCITFSKLQAKLSKIGVEESEMFLESAHEFNDGWGFKFDKKNIPISQKQLNGEWWESFLASTCPAILLHGKNSWVVNQKHIEDMASKRDNTEYTIFKNSGHTVTLDEPGLFIKTVKNFLEKHG
ncbi:alpha/beta hydrolase [Enterococcus faecium]|uniref:alpha/beta fold hydrolase n=1 Tax=Listeria monocytogenes TaxID=1639 RepID=UPI001572B6D0|nr:alpha/beta hydrolase [Enterococcus faecium]NTM26038.1 alpha/beta hydrolase [Enterococcus faecium]HAB9279723.1 alpha/beta fold hydrolase [Listeria monocytogenes]HDT9925448.1 alpha/beta hydrolase [Listeria monocytogenes]HEL8589912.1 alpha/beta hydrolase [Listeria monocytogenes]